MVQRANVSVPKRFSVDEYYRMAEIGIFHDQRTELIDGEVFVMPPRLEEHNYSVMCVRRELDKAFGPGYLVREEKPVRFNNGTEPEPDVAVVKGELYSSFSPSPPDRAELIVEIAVTTLEIDREKSGLYARANVSELWIVDVRGRRVEVYRDPEPFAGVAYGYRYRTVSEYGEGDTIRPLAAPAGTQPAAVKLMLPPR
jgi:Uma2 family endonuclease